MNDKGTWIASAPIRRPAILCLAVITLWVDYITGPSILFPIAFVLPVVLTAWYDGFPISTFYVILLPLARFGMRFVWPDVPVPLSHWVVNVGIRILALGIMAWLASRAGRLTREVRVLQGLLPMCMYCHRMRNASGKWDRLEVYLENHSEASITHGICPQCMSKQA